MACAYPDDKSVSIVNSGKYPKNGNFPFQAIFFPPLDYRRLQQL